MAAKPWENRLMEQHCPATITKTTKKSEDFCVPRSMPFEPGSVNVKKNNVTTKISAKPPTSVPSSARCGFRSISSPSSEFRYDESSASSSSVCASTPVSGISWRAEEGNGRRPAYMGLTQSIRAKQKSGSATGRKATVDTRSCNGSGTKIPSSKFYGGGESPAPVY